KGIIVDDESKSRSMLKTMCEKYCENLDICALAASVGEAIQLIAEHQPDVVFVDIRMPVKSGFALLDHYQSIPFAVIFTTAYDQYALRAFKYSAVDYLLKPISIDELVAAVKRAGRLMGVDQKARQMSLLKEAINNEKINKIALITLDGFTFVRFDEIVRCEAQGNYTSVYLSSGNALLITKTLKHYEEILVEKMFFRVHKSHLINLNYVRRFIRGKQGMIEMNDGTQIEVSLRKKEALLKKLATLS
ncbi:MAG: LytTR family DNA-binding domain-containing protein, partial [Bacteroidota bacterium]